MAGGSKPLSPVTLAMTQTDPGLPPPLPERLKVNLRTFRSRMRRTKLTEHFAIALAAILVSYLAVAALDRFFDTSAIVRTALFFASLALAAVVVPRALRRWYFKHSDLRQVAREVSLRDEATGDRLLGVFELSRDVDEFRRSPELVRAAIAQGDRDLGDRDLGGALPPSHHRRALGMLAIPAALALTFAATLPAVAGNAFQRWAMPFAGIERYTFARLDGLEKQWVVAIQEDQSVALSLAEETRTRPSAAELRYSGGTLTAPLENGGYSLALPPLASDETALLVVGDVRESIELAPRERPEIVAADARVTLPAYLEIEAPLERDVRGGSLRLVDGARVDLVLGMSRVIARATARCAAIDAAIDAAWEASNDVAVTAEVENDTIRITQVAPPSIDEALGASLGVDWVDEIGLEGHSEFELNLRTRVDEAPVVALSGAPAESVLLESVPLTFDVLSTDDFGVRRTGLEWREVGRFGRVSEEVLGSKVIDAGAPDADTLQSFATFRPSDYDLRSGVYELRGWAEDALPGREPSYSTPIRVRVMTPSEHMEWITASYDRWIQRATEVRDREMELLAENKAIHALTNRELDAPETRTRIENQARAERGNRARLQGLAAQGEKLLSEATRNPEFGSNALNDMAEANAKLKEIADQRMDSVAKLLQSAARSERSSDGEPPAKPATGTNPSGGEAMAKAPSSGAESSEGGESSESGDPKFASADPPPSEGGSKSESPKMIGENRNPSQGSGEPSPKTVESEEDEIPPTPMIMDGESAIAGATDEAQAAKQETEDEAGPPPPPPSLGLVETTLGPVAGGDEDDSGEESDRPRAPEPEEPPSKTKEEIARAIAEQEALLAAFNEVAGEMEDVLASLQNSTFVKRLKAASRAHSESADDLDVSVSAGFGSTVATSEDAVIAANTSVAERRDVEVPKLTDLHGDLDAYFDRLERRSSSDAPKFERVIEQWNELRPTLLADTLVEEAEGGRPGDARASADFLSDTFDRWGEELVGPG